MPLNCTLKMVKMVNFMLCVLQLETKLKEKFLSSHIPLAMLVPLVLNLSMNCAGGRQCRFRDF